MAAQHWQTSAATAVLPPRAATVAMKTLAATMMAGSQTTINNQLKSAMATATETKMMTATTMKMETKAMAAAEAQRQHVGGSQLGGGSQVGGGGQLGGGSGSLAIAQRWRQWRRRQRQVATVAFVILVAIIVAVVVTIAVATFRCRRRRAAGKMLLPPLPTRCPPLRYCHRR